MKGRGENTKKTQGEREGQNTKKTQGVKGEEGRKHKENTREECWDSLIFHVSTMTSRKRDTRPNHTTTGLALSSSLTLETRSHPWVAAGHPQYTGAWFAKEAVDGPSQHHRRRQANHCARL